VFKTPKYKEELIHRPVNVNMQLFRPSDAEGSEPIQFTYMPEDPGIFFPVFAQVTPIILLLLRSIIMWLRASLFLMFHTVARCGDEGEIEESDRTNGRQKDGTGEKAAGM
jgi:hypothetical protein